MSAFRAVLLAIGAGVALPAAAAIDTTAALASVADASTAVVAVGTAIIALAGVSMAIRWVKASFF
jgi:hypothetical protein